MNAVTIIDFKGFDSLKTRDAVKSAFKDAFESSRCWVDFANIEFLSRAAAHELLTIKATLSQKNVDISFINLNEQVNEMLELVKKSSKSPKDPDFRFVKWLTFKTEEAYRDYLMKY